MQPHRLRFLLVFLALALASCSERESASERDRHVAEAPARDQPPPSKPPALEIARGDVEALVDRWLQAQNSGDFALYEGLYAKRLTGIKRAAERTTSFDRDGWLADRKRMFKKPMVVEITELMIRTSHDSAVASFVQSWSSGTFRDVGPKQLVIVRDGDDLEIAREEMLSSTVDSAPTGTVLTTESFAPILGDWMLLGPATPEQGSGSPELIELAGEGYTVKDEVTDAVRQAQQHWVGRSVTAVAVDGKRCAAKTGKLAILAGVRPHFGVVQDWGSDLGARGRPSTDEERADDVYRMGNHYLVVAIDADCDARWIRTEAARDFTTLARVEAPEIARAASEAFATLPSWKSAQRDFVADGGARNAAWDDGARSVVIFRDAARHRHLVVVSAEAGAGCGAFWRAESAIYEVPEGRPPRLLAPVKIARSFVPDAAVDLDDDGNVEFLDDRVLVGVDGGDYVELLDTRWPDQDCPC